VGVEVYDHLTPRRGELDGVVDQVIHYLAQVVPVAAYRHRVQALDAQVHALGFGDPLKHGQRLADDAGQTVRLVGLRHAAAFPFRQQQQLTDEYAHLIALLGDVAKESRVLLDRPVAVERDFDRTANGGER